MNVASIIAGTAKPTSEGTRSADRLAGDAFQASFRTSDDTATKPAAASVPAATGFVHLPAETLTAGPETRVLGKIPSRGVALSVPTERLNGAERHGVRVMTDSPDSSGQIVRTAHAGIGAKPGRTESELAPTTGPWFFPPAVAKVVDPPADKVPPFALTALPTLAHGLSDPARGRPHELALEESAGAQLPGVSDGRSEDPVARNEPATAVTVLGQQAESPDAAPAEHGGVATRDGRARADAVPAAPGSTTDATVVGRKGDLVPSPAICVDASSAGPGFDKSMLSDALPTTSGALSQPAFSPSVLVSISTGPDEHAAQNQSRPQSATVPADGAGSVPVRPDRSPVVPDLSALAELPDGLDAMTAKSGEAATAARTPFPAYTVALLPYGSSGHALTMPAVPSVAGPAVESPASIDKVEATHALPAGSDRQSASSLAVAQTMPSAPAVHAASGVAEDAGGRMRAQDSRELSASDRAEPPSKPERTPRSAPDLVAGTVAVKDRAIITTEGDVGPLDVVGTDGGALRGEPAPPHRIAAHLSATVGSAEAARAVSAQIADAVARSPDRPIEIALAPEELGSVRLTLSTTDTGLAMAIVADRPETLDLLRRHIDSLAQDFRDMGLGDVRFSFGQSDNQSHRDAAPRDTGAALDGAWGNAEASHEHPKVTQDRASASGRLDLRL